jgi:hypothetical protein
MRIQWLAAVTAAVVMTGVTQAQPAKQTEPTVEVRLRSINDLLDKAEFVGGIIGKEDLVNGVKGLLKVMIKEKTGLEGIDPKRPFGLYANLSVDVVNSPVVLMIPIADQERFLKLLKDRLEIVPEKAEDGTLKVFVPIVNELYLRFTNDYLYIGRTVQDLDPKTLISTKTFFGKEDNSVASLIIRLDKIPDDTKKFVFGQFELQVAEQRKINGAKEDPIEKIFLDFAADGLSGGLKTFLDDAKELKARVYIEDKSDELSAEVTLTAKQGSTMAKTLSSFAGKTSLPAAIVASKDPAVRVTLKGALTPELKKRYVKAIEEASEEAIKKADPNAKAVVRQALEALGPTFKAAEIDGAFALNGPNAKGKYSLMLAVAVKQGKEIEKLLKELSLSAGGVADFEFDAEKIGDFSLHKITLSALPPELEEIFGTKNFWLAVSDSNIALSIEPDGAAIKAGLKSKAIEVPVLSVDVSVAKLLPIIGKDLKPDEVKAILKDAFGDDASTGKDKVTVTLTSGNELSLKAKVKGKAVRVLFALDQLKKK